MIRAYHLQIIKTKVIQLLPITNLYLELEGIVIDMPPRFEKKGWWFWKKSVKLFPKPCDYWWSDIDDSFFYVDESGSLRMITKDIKPMLRTFIK